MEKMCIDIMLVIIVLCEMEVLKEFIEVLECELVFVLCLSFKIM